jgi:L-ascorbate metabolism protein UlaG (beta-lactamase superfamily)
MDADTLKRVRKVATVCVPKGLKPWFRKRRFKQVHEFEWWQTQDLGDLRVTFVPAQHFSGRSPFDRNRTLFGGWIVQSKHRTVYHAGDSGYFDGFKEIGKRFPKIDVACLPVGAYEPRWFMRPFHVDPDEAGQAFLDVKAEHFMPIHWGAFRLSDERMDDPPKRIRAFFEKHDLKRERLYSPDLGQTIPVASRH